MNLDKIISLALEEDSALNDITSKNIISKDTVASAVLMAKHSGIICGLDVFKQVFLKLDKNFHFEIFKNDGQKVKNGDIILKMKGPAYYLLCGERTALNFIQALSGIATTTNIFANIVKNTNTCIYDTRKTMPGLRHISKYAVRCGGGKNHRMSLADMVLIKDNHLKLITNLVKKVEEIRKKHKNILIQVECETKKHVLDALKAKVDLIMLDNMKKEQVKKMIKLIRQNSTQTYKPEIEISGGVNLNTIKEYAKLGIDRISIGMLTHSAPSLDISLKIKAPK